MLYNWVCRVIRSSRCRKLIWSVLIIFLLLLVKTGEAAESITITDDDQNIHITSGADTWYSGCCLGHLGGSAVGDINGDGVNDLIVSSLYADITRYKLIYLPSDQDEWTEESALSLWSAWLKKKVDNKIIEEVLPVTSDYNTSITGSSISTTRTKTGTVFMKLSFLNPVKLDFVRDVLHMQVYAGDSNERLKKIKIWAPGYANRLEYDYNLPLKDGEWTKIDVRLSDFSKIGSPDENNVKNIVITFWGGTAGDIKIDNLYFEHYKRLTFLKAGAVYLFYGGFTANRTLDEADVVIKGVDSGDMTGEYITTGDINGDGFDDIIIGAPAPPVDDQNVTPDDKSGAVYVVFGGRSLPSAVDLKTDADYTVYGKDPGDRFGQTVHASDINGDHIADLIIGALSADRLFNDGKRDWDGEIHIIKGYTELSGVLDLGSGDTADISIYGGKYDKLGTQATIGTGDIYNDGRVDLVIGVWAGDRNPAADRSSNEGRILIINDIGDYSGTIDLNYFTPDTVILGAAKGDRLSRVAIGDVNNDGIDDIIAGAEDAAGGAGRVFVFFGSSSFPSGTLETTDAGITITGADAGDNLGLKVYASDISNDGIDDILIIAPRGDVENGDKTDSGAAYVIYGSPDLPQTINLADTPADLTVYSADNRIDENGSSRGDLRDIIGGDISGDGINDLILGYRYTGRIVALYDGFQRYSDNSPPSKPQLVSPADGRTGLETTVEFRWLKSTDPDGDAVTYTLYVCDTSGCITSENTASLINNANMLYYAGTGSGLLVFGIVLAGGMRGKKKTALLLVIIMAASLFLVSCGSSSGGGGGETTPAADGNEIIRTVSGLKPATTYYWKVLADDGNRGITESEVRSFTTR
ncbi:MAG: hypothetical protein GXP46_13250 [Deferribacteres bacterium]|nr:hypothetical protein [Deferribacteres bacterium]